MSAPDQVRGRLWHPCAAALPAPDAAALPAPDAAALVLTDAGDVHRARVHWTGRAWRWCYWNRDAAIGADVTHWAELVLPGEEANGAAHIPAD